MNVERNHTFYNSMIKYILAIGQKTLSRYSNRLWSFIQSQRFQSILERIILTLLSRVILL